MIITVMSMLLLCRGQVLCNGAGTEAGPRLAIPEATWDFGTIKDGDVVTKKIEVLNTGSADLKINRLWPSCKCTSATTSKKVIKPGGSAVITVRFEAEGYRGRVTNYIQVKTNDYSSRADRIVLKCTVRPKNPEFDISLEDNFFVFEAEAGEQVFTIKNKGDNDVIIKDIGSSSSGYEVSISCNTVKKHSSVDASVKLDGREPEQGTTEYIYLKIAIPIKQ